MFNPQKLEEFAKQVNDAMPAGVKNFGEEVECKMKHVLQTQLEKLNLVSREDFDVQTHVLLRTREKLTAVEARLAELEKRLDDKIENEK